MNRIALKAYDPFFPNGEDETGELKLKAELRQSFLPYSQFRREKIPERKLYLGSWFKEGDSGFIYGARGAGKTWLGSLVGDALSKGNGLFSWEGTGPVTTLYVDGEMPFDSSRHRFDLLQANDNLWVLHHDVLFHHCGRALNLVDPLCQIVIKELCLENKIQVIIADNLSCLCSGMAENESFEWEKMESWLLDLRRNRIAFVGLHHAGRGGYMRGTSKREDSLFWIIKVTEKEKEEDQVGAFFTLHFDKQRNSPRAEADLDIQITPNRNGPPMVSFEEMSTELRVLNLIKDGLSSASDIAAEIGCNKSNVSRAAQKLITKNLVERSGRGYCAVGFMRK